MYKEEKKKALAYWSVRGFDVSGLHINVKEKSNQWSVPVIGYQKGRIIVVYADKAKEYNLDLSVVIAHEIGHYLGFRHYDRGHEIMKGTAKELGGKKL